MDSKHVFGGVVAAFLFGFVVLYSSRGRENIKASEKNRSKKTLESSGNGVCRSNFAGNTDVIIVGAGVAGSALAYALAKIVFSFAAVLKDGRRTAISYPSNACSRSFHHGRFIQKLREKAASLPNVKLEQGTVTSLVEENGSIKGVLYKTKAGQELAASASLTIVCDGCFSNLRRNLCNPKNYNLPYANRAYFILKDSIVVTYPLLAAMKFVAFRILDLAKEGKISEAQVDSFNLPMYVPSLEEMMELVQKNGCFDIEKMELTSPGVLHESMTNTSSMGKAIVMHVRAGMERMLIQHFGSEIIDELFNRYAKKFEEFPHHVQPSKKVQLFVVLKRK
ncbi:squalene monooxygenase [Populus alba x Populus x berolinensis]|uniref:Squalene monooxygenase n=1 Tax=Populus alba x Populus x berolinensis TaxID=444605 RepID=A0AAD6PP86_9ROSI|nr:squalene monooxygenase [Populus alba x Populus x berolinensis]